MTKHIIYYTSNKLEEPTFSICQQQLLKANLPIISVSLKPIDFGMNIVLDMEPSFVTMLNQIITGLRASDADYVFFCEHDCLYPLSHFQFTPPRDDVFYYNSNVWRWDYPNDRAITYNRLISLSGLCVNRKLVLNNYEGRLKIIYEKGWDKETTREPDWARKWGYEPGTKKVKRGGFNDEDFDTWKSYYPIIDIRHGSTFSKRKVTLDSFKHLPIGWVEATLSCLPGWDLKGMFKL